MTQRITVRHKCKAIVIRLAVLPLVLCVQACSQSNPANDHDTHIADGMEHPHGRPNIILMMADDLGWGDTGYNGHPTMKTPNLDRMAREGLVFSRFYSAAPVCSPTRGSCLTGRHPSRYEIDGANSGHMKSEELTLAEALKPLGYTTGHFGKWHLGTLTTEVKDSNRGRPGEREHYSPPWQNGFDVCFSTEAKVPTWDPMRIRVGEQSGQWWNPIKEGEQTRAYGTRYWTGPEQVATDNLDGSDSRIIMDRALTFIRGAGKRKERFFAVIWFHAPHWPVVADSPYRDDYASLDDFSKNHLGCITALDTEVGRLRDALDEVGVSGNTMIWFCADNGPEGRRQGIDPKCGVGSTGGLRGRKRDLYEGGVRVPGILVWPERVRKPRVTDIPCVTSDYLPTVLDILGCRPEDKVEPLDGVSLLPLIQGRMKERPEPIGFQSGPRLALTDNRYKIVSYDNGRAFSLFDLIDDPAESKDLSKQKPEVLRRMKATLTDWLASCQRSRRGLDYRN